jgi:hypothetical protein
MSEGNIKVLNLNDSVIAHIAKLLQMSMLTGTDIVDHMRMIRLVEKEETLVLDEEYSSIFDGTLDKMMKNVEAKDIQE